MAADQDDQWPAAWLCIAQPPTALANANERVEYIKTLASALARQSAGDSAILVLPELYLSGYGQTLADAAAAAGRDKQYLPLVRSIARTEGIWIVTGLARSRRAGVGNTAVAINPEGDEVADYDKIFLFGEQEKQTFSAGGETVIFDSPLGRTALAICYDVEQPSLGLSLSQAGASTLLVPTANMAPYSEVPIRIVPELAAEAGMRVAYANHAGMDGELRMLGGSTVVDETGRALSHLGDECGVDIVRLPHDRLPRTGSVQRRSYRRLTD